MCKSFNYALRIETLLHRVWPGVPKQGIIRLEPYDCIETGLNYLYAEKPSKKEEISLFEERYQSLRGKSIDQLWEDGVDVDLMINELELLLG